jgi:2-polyprenyl-3-methyl-5-hydroxy-6-metoxy-1,4-benzoquinol methylase
MQPNNPLHIVSTSSDALQKSGIANNRREETQAKFERLWLTDPERFNPLRNCMERERLDRTAQLLKEFIDVKDRRVVDLGCGEGCFSHRMTEAGATVDAVDIANNALKLLKTKYPDVHKTIQDYLPKTRLKEDAYDIVLAMEVIAYLYPDDYRLFFSELARLVNTNGYVLCSTAIDTHSEDALQRFGDLAETEFKVEKWRFSHHLFYMWLCEFFEAPSRFVRARKDREYRQEQINQRYGFNKWWFKLNSHPIPAGIWGVVQYLTRPVARFLNQSRGIMLSLEKVCRTLWADAGITHAMFIGIRRPLVMPVPKEIPRELKHKRQVWE